MSSALRSMQSKSARRRALEDPTEPCWATEDVSVPPANNDQIRSEQLPPSRPAPVNANDRAVRRQSDYGS